MKRNIFTGFLTIVILLSFVSTTALLVTIAKQYSDTKKWNTDTMHYEIHNVPPQLAENYIPLDNAELLEILAEVNSAIDNIPKLESIKDVDYERLSNIYRRAKQFETERGLEGSDLTTSIDRLGIYLEIERLIPLAYSQVDSEPFKQVTARLSTYLLDDPTKLDRDYALKLTQVSKDYKLLHKFITDTLPKIGDVEESKLYVSSNVGSELTKDIINQINKFELDKFEKINKLKNLMTGSEWTKILRYTDSKRQHDEWLSVKSTLESLQQSNYVAISRFRTLQDVLDYGYLPVLEERIGYTISLESPVLSVSYEDKIIPTNKYIKKGSDLDFQIQVQYEIIPEPEPEVEEEPDDTILDIDMEDNEEVDNNEQENRP